MQLYTLQSGWQSGALNMALDEALLELLRDASACQQVFGANGPVLVVRTYQWDQPTLSLGANQAVKDIATLQRLYAQGHQSIRHLVRRPTGGRAILHGEDISYAFITNDPAVLKLNLKDAYAIYAGLVQDTLAHLGLPVRFSGQTSGRDYLRSPVCFETHTPSDLLAADGRKLTGSAQLRRAGGLLQHGAAFLKPHHIEPERFSQALFDTVSQAYGCTAQPFPLAMVAARQHALEAVYRNESGEIWASVLTTNGSHNAPASC